MLTPSSKAKEIADKPARGRKSPRRQPAGAVTGYARAYLAAPLDRVAVIRKGLPAAVLVETSKAMQISGEQIYRLLHLPRATMARKIAENGVLSPEVSERVLGLRRLIGQVEVMVRDSGEPAGFNAATWVARWLNAPSPALGDQKPGDFLDTVEGQALVSNLLARLQSGAYA